MASYRGIDRAQDNKNTDILLGAVGVLMAASAIFVGTLIVHGVDQANNPSPALSTAVIPFDLASGFDKVPVVSGDKVKTIAAGLALEDQGSLAFKVSPSVGISRA